MGYSHRGWLAMAIGLAALALIAGPTTAQDDVWSAELSADEQHPCLMFTQAELPALREKLEREPYARWWASVQAGSNMVEQAFTWLITGDAEKAEAVKLNLLRANPTGYHCSCGVASALQGCAEAYDFIYHYEGLSEDDHRAIRAKLANSCERMYLSALESGAGQHPGNQRTRGICALGTAALVLRGYKDAEHTPAQWLQRALDGIHQEANLEFWRADGMFIEGPAYSSFTMSIMLPFARYYHQSTGKWLFDDPRLRNAVLYLIYVTQPDGDCAAIGTTNSGNMIQSLRMVVGAGDPRVQALCRWTISEWGNLGGGGVRDIGLFDDSVPPSLAGFPTTRFYPATQEAHLRSEWSRNSVALWFKGKDPWLARTHRVYSHGDVGGFVLHAYGEVLAVDAGYDHWVSYDLYPPELHNTLLVDGNGPVNETAGLLEHTLDAGFMQTGDIVSEYAGIKHRRTFLMVDDTYTIIADDISADAAHDYAWQIHTPVNREGGAVNIDGSRASWTGFDPRGGNPGKVSLDAVWAGPVELATMEKSRWQPFSSDPATGSYDNWALVAGQNAQDTRYLTALYPRPLSQDPPRILTPDVDGARCIIVEGDGWRDTALVSEGAVGAVGTIASTSRTCLVRESDGELRWAYLTAPGRLEYAGQTVIELADAEAGCAVVSFASEADRATGRLYVSGPAGMKVTARCAAAPARLIALDGRRVVSQIAALDGAWTFTVPDGATGPLVVMPGVDAPALADDLQPGVTAVTVDDENIEPAEIIDIGRVSDTPSRLQVSFSDEGAGIDPESLRVTLDGLPIRDCAMSDEGAVAASIPADVTEDDHEVVVQVRDRALPPNRAQLNLRFSRRPLLVNGGFESGGERPAGWGLGAWSSNAETQYESKAVPDNPRSGKWCLMMKGVAGGLNMVASQTVPLELGQTYLLKGYYRGDVAAKASFCSRSGRNQYLWSPPLDPSKDWVPFEWEFTVENPEDTLIVAMRLGAVGTVYFDDLSLEHVGVTE